MAAYNLTPKQRDIVKGLVRLYESGHDGEFMYDQEIGSNSSNWITFFGSKERIPATMADLTALRNAGFITLREGPLGELFGGPCGLAYEAVNNDFVVPQPPVSAINIGAYITNNLGGSVQGVAGANNTLNQNISSAELQERFSDATDQLSAALQRILDGPQYRAAMGSIVEVEQQLQASSPDTAAVSKATRSLGERLFGALDFGDKLGGSIQAGVFITEALIRLAGWANIAYQIIQQSGSI